MKHDAVKPNIASSQKTAKHPKTAKPPKATKRKRRAWRAVALCYAAVLLVCLVACGVRLGVDSLHLQNGSLARRVLSPVDFAAGTTGLEFSANWAADSHFVSTDADPQLHVELGKKSPVALVVFDAVAVNKPAGEIVLYYAENPEEAFSEARKLPARRDAAGRWVFDLGGRSLSRLRLDPGSVGGVYWQVNALVLNETKAPPLYFVPDTLQGAVLLFAPLLVWAVWKELDAFLHPVWARRRLARRWRDKAGRDTPNA